MLSYVMVGTNDLARALNFYDSLMPELGAKRMMELPRGVMYGNGAGAMFGVVTPFNGEAASSGNGTMMTFAVKNEQEITRLHALALSLGAQDEGAPGVRGPFFCAYFRDLDGNKFNFFCFLK